MVRIGDTLIICKLECMDIDKTISYNKELIKDGLSLNGVNIFFEFSTDGYISIPQCIYGIKKDILCKYRMDSALFNNCSELMDVYYEQEVIFVSDKCIEKENLYTMIYGTDNNDGLTKDEIEQLFLEITN